MIQPQEGEGDAGDPPLYRTGCAGRIIEFRETEDGRYLITLTGLARFDVAREPPRDAALPPHRAATGSRYRGDLERRRGRASIASGCSTALKPYFRRHGITAESEALEAAPDERLVTSLAMAAPFAPSEKQALLEARDRDARGRSC